MPDCVKHRYVVVNNDGRYVTLSHTPKKEAFVKDFKNAALFDNLCFAHDIAKQLCNNAVVRSVECEYYIGDIVERPPKEEFDDADYIYVIIKEDHQNE